MMKWVGLIFFCLLVGYFLSRDSHSEKETDTGPTVLPAKEEEAEKRVPAVRLITGNPFIEEYGAPEYDTKNDLKIVKLLIHNAQLLIKDFDSYFLPENQQITGFLQGRNRDRLGWIPRSHNFVNDQGELVDRWGTPLFFHRQSGFQFELRSAGPDRQHWTKDDVCTQLKPTN